MRASNSTRSRKRRAIADPDHESRIQAALDGLQKGKYRSVRDAANKENVARSTLEDRKSGKHKAWKDAFVHLQLLQPPEEQAVMDWVGHCAVIGRPFHVSDLKSAAHDVSGKVPGKNWHERVSQRHPEIVSSRPAHLDPKRAANFNEPTIKDYFDKLEAVFTEFNGIPAGNLWNMDEKGVQMGGGRNRGRKKHLFIRDMRDRYKIRSDNLELVTIIECISASGEAMPPSFVLSDGPAPDTREFAPNEIGIIAFSKSGWTDNELGIEWVKEVFIPEALARREDHTKPAVLIYDGHGSHESFELKQYIYEQGLDEEVVIIGLPSKTTHKTQPLDAVVFTHIQTKWQDHCETSAIKRRSIDRYNVIHEYMHVRKECMSPELIKKSFEKTGIYPFNPKIFPPESFAPSKIYSCKAHVPESFPPEIPSSPIPFEMDASDDEYHPSSDLDIDDQGPASNNDDQRIPAEPQISSKQPINIDLDSDCDATDAEPEDPTQLDNPEDHQAVDAYASFSSTSSSNSRITRASSISTSLLNVPNPRPPTIRSAFEDERLSPEQRFDEIRSLRVQVQEIWEAMVYWKAQAQAADAHCTLIKRELDLSKEQIANLERKKTRRSSKQTLSRVIVHKNRREEYRQEAQERATQQAAEAERLAAKEAEDLARKARMSEEERSRNFVGSLSSYKRDDLLVLARVLGVDDQGTVAELRPRIRDYILENKTTLCRNPRVSGLSLLQSSGRRQDPTESDLGISREAGPSSALHPPTGTSTPVKHT
ncbi:hypothetical protein MD484_g1314, partial [Candolleomyces efflorescens]